MISLDITLLKAGYCTQLERIAKRNGKMKMIRFPATFLLIRHPLKGIILFDTGYSEHVIKAMKQFPFQIYAKTTPVYLQKGESAREQLEQMGIKAEDVSYIIISHFHVDHLGGLLDFPNATFICSKYEFFEVKNLRGFSALRSAFIPSLLPNNFSERTIYVEDTKTIKTPIFNEVYPAAYDLFNDGSILGIRLSGHTNHQFGILVKGNDQTYFFISDACWLSETFQQIAYPSKIAKLIIKKQKDYYENINKLHEIHKSHPEVKIIPCHDDNVSL